MTPENGSDSPDAAPQRRYLPGDIEPEAHLARMLRVDHAGEYGARRIYEGQLAVLGKSACAPTLKHMHAQELVHLDRKSTRRTPVTNAHLVCRLLLEKKKDK